MKIHSKYLLRSYFYWKYKIPYFYHTENDNSDVYVTKYKNGAHAAACISADFELNWAWREKKKEEMEERGIRERENIPFLIDLLEKFNVPVTWATVGHLFLESCRDSMKNGNPHGDMPRPQRNRRWSGDWYRHDPCSGYREDPLWFCPDLIKEIKKSRVSHELASHSFSHIDFSPECVDENLIRHEMNETYKAASVHGITIRSFVFPFNIMNYEYLDIFSNDGITCIRHRDKNVRLNEPERTECGVYKIYESMNLRRTKHYDYWVKAEILIDAAIKSGKVYHLWFHPSDPKELFEKEFRKIMEYAVKKREEGLLWVGTMGEIAAYSEAKRSTRIEREVSNDQTILHLTTRYDREKYGDTDISIVIKCNKIPKNIIFEHSGEVFDVKASECIILPKGILLNIPVQTEILRLFN